MKKIVLILLLSALRLSAEVITVVPFVGGMTYSDDSAKSIKESSSLGGVYANMGTLDYLVEFSFSYMDTTYKSDANLSKQEQRDVSLIYGKYFKKFMLKVGAHYTQTNDDVLGNGIVAILGVGGYKTIGYDKLTYGVEGYYSQYENRLNEDFVTSATQTARRPSSPRGGSGDESNQRIIQVSPYFTSFKSISATMSNDFSLKLNYQMADRYAQAKYFSYEVSDTFYYKSLFAKLYAYGGEMKSGIKDGGITVYNSLDLMKTGYGAKLGYYISSDLITTLSYSRNNYEEYKITDYGSESTNSAIIATLSYRF